MHPAVSGGLTWAISVALLLGVAPARAGNDDEIFVGNGAALVGGAVVATVSDGSTLWYNPAGLGSIKRNQLDAATSVYSLAAGLFTDRAATETTEGSFVSKRSNFYGGSLGMRFSNEHLLAASEPADSLVFSSTFALRYAHADSTSDALVVDPSQDGIDQLFQMGSAPLDVHELGFYVGGGLAF